VRASRASAAPSFPAIADNGIQVDLQLDVHLSPEFSRLRSDTSLLGVVEAILGAPPVPNQGDVCRIFHPDAIAFTTPPHQDHFFTRRDPNLWTAWIPLGPCPTALGGLAVLRGSHVNGLQPHDFMTAAGVSIAVPGAAVWDSASYRAGDVLLFNALTIHRARPNLTATTLRLSADFRYGATALVPTTAA
jgi:hypothetical protein